jgi:hypothetical protein
MRSTKLSSAIVAAAGLLALAPAGALAAQAKHGVKPHLSVTPGRCRVSISATPHVVTSNESVLVSGALSCAGGEVSGQTITVYEKIAGVPGGFKVIGTPTTASDGSYTLTPPPVVTDSTFYARAVKARSANKTVRVAPQVTLSGPAPEGSQLLTGARNRVTFKGAVNPIDAGAEVLLEREAATSTEEWGVIQQHDVVQPDGTFTISHRFAIPGDANLRVVVRAHGKFNQRGVSNAMSYEISQAQNPNLTLEVKPDPVAFGQPVTIKGVVKAGAGQKVTLLARTFGTSMTKIGETTSGTGGAYEIAIPSAVQSTYYRATSGTVSSAVVFDGVKWVVTASAESTKLASGTVDTFSGTVAPATRVGHAVYLEKQNPFGGGYHVVDLGFVASGGTYSIKYDVIGSGKQVYRVKVPGDPINQAASSTPIEVEVTPAPILAPKLQPQPTLPH